MKHNIYALSLSLLTEQHGKEPGWYLSGHARWDDSDSEGLHIERKLTIAQAENIARAFEEMVPPGEEVAVHPFQIIKGGTVYAVSMVRKKLEAAEQAAQEVAQLRKALKDFGDI